jgi:hypothetical protein
MIKKFLQSALPIRRSFDPTEEQEILLAGGFAGYITQSENISGKHENAIIQVLI